MVFSPEAEEIIVSGRYGKLKKILRTNPQDCNHDI